MGSDSIDFVPVKTRFLHSLRLGRNDRYVVYTLGRNDRCVVYRLGRNDGKERHPAHPNHTGHPTRSCRIQKVEAGTDMVSATSRRMTALLDQWGQTRLIFGD